MATWNVAVVVKYGEASCSGIMLDYENGLVLTVGSLFLDPVGKSDKFSSLSSSKSFILWDGGPDSSPTVDVLLKEEGPKREDQSIFPLKGSLVLLWRDKKLQEVAERMFPASEWRFDHHNEIDTEKTAQRSQNDPIHKLADFALVRVDCWRPCAPVKEEPLRTLRVSPALQGEKVTLVGTPFGSECPHVFFNSISQGIVSNLAGSDGEILMTDAQCVPGCEGSPLFLEGPSSCPQLYGVVISPFCWRNGEWIGITLACSIKHILSTLFDLHPAVLSKVHFSLPKALTQLNSFNADTKDQQKMTNNGILQTFCKEVQQTLAKSSDHLPGDVLKTTVMEGRAWLSSIVFVQQGTTWGTGVVMDSSEALLVTCSHVVRPDLQDLRAQRKNCSSLSGQSTNQSRNTTNIKVYFGFPHPTCRRAEVLFATDPACALDLAVLRITTHLSLRTMPVRIASRVANTKAVYEKGEEVLVAGFALFPRHLNLEPMVSSGLLSNVVYSEGKAVMLQSTAAVHAGASGGALISSRTGELLGIVTSNIRDANNSTSFPHVNFSIPGNLVAQIISLVKVGDIGSGVEALISRNISEIWSLGNRLQPLPLLSKL